MQEKKPSLRIMKSAYRKMKERQQQKGYHEPDTKDIVKEVESDCISAKSAPCDYNFEEMYEAIVERDFAGYEKSNIA